MNAHPMGHPHGSMPEGGDALRLVFWELTARCNLKCQHCRAEAQEEAVANELSTEELLRVAADIRATADPIIVLSGGEPLYRPDFFPFAEQVCKMFTRVALASNGTFINLPLARRLVETGIQRVSISIDGAYAATHDAFRGLPGSFDAALRGISALREAGLPVQINVTAARHNKEELPALLELAKEVGADALHVFMLVPVGCGLEMSDDARLSPQESEEVLTWLFEQSIALRGQMHMKATCAPMYYRIMRQVSRERGIPLQSDKHGMHAMTRGCLAGSAVCFISRIGDVQPCGYLPHIAGNVRRQPFAEIWNNSELFANLRNPDLLTGKCGACGYRKVCLGCRARAYAVHGDYCAEEPDCPYQPPAHERAMEEAANA